MALPGLTLCPLRVDSGTAKFDLTLAITEEADGLSGLLEYRSDLFDAATVTRLLGHFTTLLEGIIANPNQPLAALPLLTAAERQQLLGAGPRSTAVFHVERCLHEWFEAQVERTPDATAVVCDGQQLTYQELNRQANRLAHYLRRHGVGPETLVGVCLERSLALVIGLLGILKAGGAYLPLDPAYAAGAAAFMLEDSQATVLLTQQALVAGLPPHPARVICLDDGRGRPRAGACGESWPWTLRPSNWPMCSIRRALRASPKGYKFPTGPWATSSTACGSSPA